MTWSLSLLLSLHARAALPDCSARLERIPRVDRACLAAPAGPPWMQKCSEVHQRLGPIFVFAMIPKPLVWAVPVARALARLPVPKRETFAELARVARGLNGDAVVVASPELIEAIARQPDAFEREYDRMSFDRTIGKHGILLLDDAHDPAWSKSHAALAPNFTARRVRQELPSLVDRVITESLGRFGRETSELEVTAFAEWVSAAVIYEILFDRPMPDDLFANLTKYTSAAWAGRRAPGELRTQFREVFEAHVRGLKLDSGYAHALHVDHPEFPGEWWMDQLTTLMFAGMDTTRAAMSWGIWELSRRPEWQSRLRGAEAPTNAKNFTNEALRHHTTVGMLARVALRDVRLGPYEVEKGTMVMLNFEELHRASFAWPERFDPDRFAARDLPKFAHCPFGYGNRVCLGQHLAMAELEAVYRRLARDFDLVPDREWVERDQGRGGPMAVDRDLRVRLTPR